MEQKIQGNKINNKIVDYNPTINNYNKCNWSKT